MSLFNEDIICFKFCLYQDMDRLMSGLKEGEDIFQRMYSKPQNVCTHYYNCFLCLTC